MWAPSAGIYNFTGSLQGPQGRQLAEFSFAEEVAPGVHTVSIEQDGSLVGEHLTGRYVLADLVGDLAADAAVRDRAPAGFTDVLQPSAWEAGIPDIDTLIRMWREAEASDAIQTNGLYQSNLNRLYRIQEDIEADNYAAARRELDKFISNIDPPAKIDPAVAGPISGFAAALAAWLDG